MKKKGKWRLFRGGEVESVILKSYIYKLTLCKSDYMKWLTKTIHTPSKNIVST